MISNMSSKESFDLTPSSHFGTSQIPNLVAFVRNHSHLSCECLSEALMKLSTETFLGLKNFESNCSNHSALHCLLFGFRTHLLSVLNFVSIGVYKSFKST